MNFCVSEEHANYSFTTRELRVAHTDAIGLFFWRDPHRKNLGRHHFWLEIWARDAVERELSESRQFLDQYPDERDYYDRWIAWCERQLRETLPSFAECGSPAMPPHPARCHHSVPHWYATTPAPRLTLADVHVVTHAFAKTVLMWPDPIATFEEEPLTLPEIRRSERWARRAYGIDR